MKIKRIEVIRNEIRKVLGTQAQDKEELIIKVKEKLNVNSYLVAGNYLIINKKLNLKIESNGQSLKIVSGGLY